MEYATGMNANNIMVQYEEERLSRQGNEKHGRVRNQSEILCIHEWQPGKLSFTALNYTSQQTYLPVSFVAGTSNNSIKFNH